MVYYGSLSSTRQQGLVLLMAVHATHTHTLSLSLSLSSPPPLLCPCFPFWDRDLPWITQPKLTLQIGAHHKGGVLFQGLPPKHPSFSSQFSGPRPESPTGEPSPSPVSYFPFLPFFLPICHLRIRQCRHINTFQTGASPRHVSFTTSSLSSSFHFCFIHHRSPLHSSSRRRHCSPHDHCHSLPVVQPHHSTFVHCPLAHRPSAPTCSPLGSNSDSDGIYSNTTHSHSTPNSSSSNSSNSNTSFRVNHPQSQSRLQHDQCPRTLGTTRLSTRSHRPSASFSAWLPLTHTRDNDTMPAHSLDENATLQPPADNHPFLPCPPHRTVNISQRFRPLSDSQRTATDTVRWLPEDSQHLRSPGGVRTVPLNSPRPPPTSPDTTGPRRSIRTCPFKHATSPFLVPRPGHRVLAWSGQ